MPGPSPIRFDKRAHERPEILGSGGTNSEQNDTGLFEWNPALNGNLPEVLIQREHDARFSLGAVQEGNVLPSRAVSPGPKYIVAPRCATPPTIGFGKFSSARKRILRWNRIDLEFVG